MILFKILNIRGYEDHHETVKDYFKHCFIYFKSRLIYKFS